MKLMLKSIHWQMKEESLQQRNTNELQQFMKSICLQSGKLEEINNE